MKKKVLALISVIIGLLLLIGALSSVNLGKIIGALSEFKFYKYFILLILFLITFSLTVMRWKVILSSLGHKISFLSLFIAKLVSYPISYFTPFARLGGEPFRAYALKREDNIKLSIGVASVLIDKIIEITCGSLLILYGLVYILIKYTLSKNLIIALSIPFLLFVVFLYVFYFKTIRNEGFFTAILKFFKVYKIKELSKVKGGIERTEKNLSNFFIKKRKSLMLASLVSILDIIFYLILYKTILNFIGVDIGISRLFILFGLIMISQMIPIPASLGAYEGMGVLSFLIFGLSVENGLLFIVLLRIMEMTLAIVGLLFLPFYGIRLLKNNAEQEKLKR